MTPVNTTELTERSETKMELSDDPCIESIAGHAKGDNAALRVSLFDAVTSLLMAFILFIGTFVLMLLVVWMIDAEPDAVPIDPPLLRLTSSHHPPGLERDFQEPGAEEAEELQDVAIQDSLQAVTDTASSVAGAWVVNNSDALVTTQGKDSQGDSRPPGPPQEGDLEGIPAFERWQLNFSAKDLDSYARQLDHYQIELGVIGGPTSEVDYASHFTSRPVKRRAAAKDEKRLYFLWNEAGPLKRYDQQLLTAAGVELTDRIMIKFIPEKLEKRLARIELEYAVSQGHDSITEIQKTVFQSEPSAGGHQFRVINQRYRRPSR